MNVSQIQYDLSRGVDPRFLSHWARKKHPVLDFPAALPLWLEIGAGSGAFSIALAERNPQVQVIALERSRMRGKRLVYRSERSKLPNLASYRANAIPLVLHGLKKRSLERIYILYPCPWTKFSQRRNRWYLHPVMQFLNEALKPGGLFIWASDQQFYIEEAEYVSRSIYGLKTLSCGPLRPNPWNDLGSFPQGRTKFERCFLEQQQTCYELISQK